MLAWNEVDSQRCRNNKRTNLPYQFEELSGKGNDNGRKVRIRFRGINFHNALLFSEALPELTALWRSLQIMRAHLVKRLKYVLGESSSGLLLVFVFTHVKILSCVLR